MVNVYSYIKLPEGNCQQLLLFPSMENCNNPINGYMIYNEMGYYKFPLLALITSGAIPFDVPITRYIFKAPPLSHQHPMKSHESPMKSP